MASLLSRLADAGVWRNVLQGPATQTFLTTIQLGPPEIVGADREEGHATFGVVENLLGSFSLNLVAPLDPRLYVLTLAGPQTSRTAFRFALSLNEGPQKQLFTFVKSLPGHGLKAAIRKTSEDAEWLEEVAGAPDVVLTGADVWLVIRGKSSGTVEVTISPNKEAPDDVVILGLDPPTVLIGGTGFGLQFPELPSGVVLDDAEDATPPGKTIVDGVTIATPADTPAWRGLAVRTARLFLPKDVPFLGGHSVEAHLQIGRAPTPGIDLIILAKVPPKEARPGIEVRIECQDPTATGLDGFVPTLVEAVMELPVPGRTESIQPGVPITFGGGKPVKIRARFSRKAAAAGVPPSMELSMAVESQGPDGLVKIDSASGGLGAKVAVTAATVATALVADGQGPALHTLLTAAVGLSSFLDDGQLVLHRAEILTSGSAAPVGNAVQFKIDYSVAAVVTGIDVGVLSVHMNPSQPLRVRVREVVLTVDPEKSGLDMVSLDYTKSSLEVEDPGGWKVQGLDNLFDVLGTRSGRGSMWIEVDLRFKLDLGPVKVSGATIRGTLDGQGKLSGELRGLDASIALAGLIDGKGAVQLTEDGFRAALSAGVDPLGVTASAGVETSGDMVKLELGVDLPGPIPLANTGLGIYGVGGMFVANGRPKPVPPGDDAIKFQLDWDYRDAGSFVPSSDFSFGLEAVIGTAPDMGFTFSARAGIFLTTPDLVIRGSLKGLMMAPRVTIARKEPVAKVLEAKGVVVIDPKDAVTIAVDGVYEIPHVVVTHVPVAARFPTKSPDWFIHLGSDGWMPGPGIASEGREAGPIRSTIFPEILGQSSDAYIMFRGNGITEWPRGGQDSGGLKVTLDPRTFVSAFGFGFIAVWGLKPIVWAELFARADILFSTHPTTMVAMGRVGGGLHIGIFSLGVDATVYVQLMENLPPHLHAEVCGTVDLFFDEIHKCVGIDFNSEPTVTMPPPDVHPLDGPQTLVNDRYEVIAPLFGSREEATELNAVWPDAIPLLTFVTAPTLAGPFPQFPKATPYPTGVRAKPLGGELSTYDWELSSVTLIDATDAANEKVVPGPFSAAWLDGKFGDAGGQAQPAELALFTPWPDLWFDRLPDAGKSLPHDPLGQRADICRLQAAARLGWAPGALARVAGDGWALPPDPVSVDPLQSQVRAELELRWLPSLGSAGFVLDRLSVQRTPPQVTYAMPHVPALGTPAVIDGRRFTEYLDLGGALLPNGAIQELPVLFVGPAQQLRVTFEEPLRQARLWLVIPRAAFDAHRFQVVDSLGAAWPSGKVEALDADRVAVLFALPGAGEAASVLVTYPVGVRLGVLGVNGITRAAALAAAARNAATKAEADALAAAAAGKPPQPGDAASTTARCVLDPGRVYRIDVEMRWAGVLSKFNDQGKKEEIARKKFQDAPAVPPRQFWFRTAKPKPASQLAQFATVERFQQIHHKRDFFHPQMIERYLSGYEPAQSELFRFADDPVRVHFRVTHVGALAAAYGYKLSCGLRRLDAPAEVDPDQVVQATLEWAAAGSFLNGGQAVRAEVYAASACRLPPPNVVLQAPMKLSRLAWYEVFTLAEAVKAEEDGRLPGVSFRTSRWATGTEMLRALQFKTPVAGRSTGLATGGAMLRPDALLQPEEALGDDAAFDAFLDRSGLDGWPAATEPRVSLLWREQAGAWLCAGVLVESPEPIHRPGRFELDSLTLAMGAAGNAVPFDIRLRDRSGSRVLFATSTPFLPRRIGASRNQPLLRLNCRDLPVGIAPTAVNGSLTVPFHPSFAEEAL